MVAAAVAFSACNEMLDDVYGELDNTVVVPLNKGVDYTLQEADYTAISTAALKDFTSKADSILAVAVKTTGALNSFATADKYVPAVLAKAFPALNKNSTAQVSYAYAEDYLATLAGAPTHTLTAADYETVRGAGTTIRCLSPVMSPATKLPVVLKTRFPNAQKGDVTLATYKYADEEPSADPTCLSEDFTSFAPATASPYTKWEGNGWTQVITQGGGTKYWRVRTRNGSNYAEFSANGGENEVTEAYIVSPLVDLTQTTNNLFSFDLVVGYWNYNGLEVLITEDATALTNPAGVTWDTVTKNFNIPEVPVSTYGDMVTAGALNLDADYAGKKIYIAFKYNGETGTGNTHTTTYQIDNILVSNVREENAIYTYSGTAWAAYPDAVILNPADYTAMGLTTISAANAPVYLPSYLQQKFPYALQGTKKTVVYKSGATTYAADEYVFAEGRWQSTFKAALRTEQFVHNGEGWVFDPTVNHTMLKADYQLMCTYVLGHPDLGIYNRIGTSGTPYTNEEWYYGFAAFYDNVNFRLSGSVTSSREVPSSKENDTELHSLSTNGEKIELLWKRLTEKGMMKYLELKYPESQVSVQGIQQYYNISVVVYYPDGITNTSTTYTLRYKALTPGSAGTPPTFEYEGKECIANCI
jgi:hypothetical protein